MNLRPIFLTVSAVGLVPIALAYGLVPTLTIDYLFGLPVQNTNGAHIFRAVMGLYLALASYWLLGAWKTPLRQSALQCLVVFMFGLAGGRLLSLAVDGIPNGLLLAYLGLELGCGVVGLLLLNQPD